MASPEPIPIAVEVGGREAVLLRWGPRPSAEDAESAWRLDSEPDWRLLDSIRLVSAQFDDGAALGVAALRPSDARGHGDDVLIARFVDTDGEETATSDVLVSVEYGADGAPQRLGLELWVDPESPPMRVAANRADADTGAGRARQAVPMRFRLDGTEGAGLYETVRPA